VIEAVRPWLADALAILGLLVMTLAVVGMVRMPTLQARLHAAGKAVGLGIVPLLAAAATSGEPAVVARAAVVAAFVLLTAPVSSHAIARVAYLRHRRVERRRPDGGHVPGTGGAPLASEKPDGGFAPCDGSMDPSRTDNGEVMP
jgi:multicomponent Na+:H+ antiporter subunit G